MYYYGETSKARLATCHPDLQRIVNFVIKHIDVTIVCGTRGEEEQQEAFDNGYSTVQYPNSKHNSSPSMAVDAVPYPTMWSDMDAMQVLGGFVMGVASLLFEKGFLARGHLPRGLRDDVYL